ncbi:hypothetical protein CLOP_g8957 [Closterium sp. NIES-67]|nr:hypothetical protein CLOP_g8957 [Closterium sp. NIES-67]
MVWHKSLPKEKMVLSLEEEMDWMPDLDITRVIPAGVFAVMHVRNITKSEKRYRKIFNKCRALQEADAKVTT